MMLILQIGFWITVLFILHSYVLFPYVLYLLGKNKKENSLTFLSKGEDLPSVAVLMAVHNEEAVIEKKIYSLFASDYPLDKLHFYIGSDCSKDQTEEKIRKLQTVFPSLHLEVFHERTGKVEIINCLENVVKEPILVLTDANVFFDTDTIYQLVKHFKNPAIAVVGGNILNEKYKTGGISFQEKKYLERENFIKYHEGLIWGVMIGAFGGCYAIRKKSYTPVPSDLPVDDFYISMNVLKKGDKAISEMKAISYEDVSNKMSEEFRRKVRISMGNFQNLKVYKNLLWPPFTALAFCFFSHKVLRWITPFLLIVALVLNNFLFDISPLYKFTFIVQIAFLLVPLLDVLLKKIEINFKLFRFITHFYSMNLALLVGFFKYSTGVKLNVWKPTERNQ